jgi:hypothetical protein
VSRAKTNVDERIAQRVWQVAVSLGLRSERAIAKAVACNPGHLSELLSGKKGWTDKMLHRVAAALGVSPEVLLGTSCGQAATVDTYRTGGGDRWGAVEEAPIEHTQVPPPDQLVAFRVEGDSMEPVARDGQVVLALRDVQPKDGDLAHVELEDGTVTFKRIYIRRDRWLLLPVNPAYNPTDVPASEIRRAMKVWGVKF